MPDHRSRRQKLEAMARQTVSPHEAEVARRKLVQMGPSETVIHAQNTGTETITSYWTVFYGVSGTSNVAPDDRPGGWNPSAWVAEPHWFEGWFSGKLRREGMDERSIANSLSEMRRKNGW